MVAGLGSATTVPLRRTVPSAAATRLLSLIADGGSRVGVASGGAFGCVTEAELRSVAADGWRSMRGHLESLLALDLVSRHQFDGVVAYEPCVDVHDPFERLVAVELKLRDWRSAVAQAARYRLFADASYIAMPCSRLSEAALAEARRNRVGVLSLHSLGSEGPVTVLVEAPLSPPLQPLRRRWASEVVLASVTRPGGRIAGSPIC